MALPFLIFVHVVVLSMLMVAVVEVEVTLVGLEVLEALVVEVELPMLQALQVELAQVVKVTQVVLLQAQSVQTSTQLLPVEVEVLPL
jgi:hypothetical protein